MPSVVDIESAYLRHKNLKLAADELGMKWQTLYVHLRRAGVPVTGDKARYGSDKDRMAAKAEAEFLRLVPIAVAQNDIRFQSKCDFMVGKEMVDVKSSTLRKGSKRLPAKRWAFSVKKQEFCADFIVCFAMTDDGYRIFMMPGELVRNYQTISISEKGKSKWKQHEISKEDLSEFFSAIVEA